MGFYIIRDDGVIFDILNDTDCIVVECSMKTMVDAANDFTDNNERMEYVRANAKHWAPVNELRPPLSFLEK